MGATLPAGPAESALLFYHLPLQPVASIVLPGSSELTSAWLSPELLLSKSQTVKVDGVCVLMELLSAREKKKHE